MDPWLISYAGLSTVPLVQGEEAVVFLFDKKPNLHNMLEQIKIKFFLVQACKGCAPGLGRCVCKGDKGVLGHRGIGGLRGLPGPPGEVGLMGPYGRKGQKGDQGNYGIFGNRGGRGDMGVPGFVGSPGVHVSI